MASETEILSSPWPWPCDETQEYRSGGKQAECCGGGMAEGALRRVRLPQETRWAVTYVTCVTLEKRWIAIRTSACSHSWRVKEREWFHLST